MASGDTIGHVLLNVSIVLLGRTTQLLFSIPEGLIRKWRASLRCLNNASHVIYIYCH